MPFVRDFVTWTWKMEGKLVGLSWSRLIVHMCIGTLKNHGVIQESWANLFDVFLPQTFPRTQITRVRWSECLQAGEVRRMSGCFVTEGWKSSKLGRR